MLTKLTKTNWFGLLLYASQHINSIKMVGIHMWEKRSHELPNMPFGTQLSLKKPLFLTTAHISHSPMMSVECSKASKYKVIFSFGQHLILLNCKRGIQ